MKHAAMTTTWTHTSNAAVWPEWPDECSCGAALPDVCDGDCPECGEPYWYLIAETCDECGQHIPHDADYWLHMDGGDILCEQCARNSSDILLMLSMDDGARYRLDSHNASIGPDVTMPGYLLVFTDSGGNRWETGTDDYSRIAEMLHDCGLPFDGWRLSVSGE